MYISVSFLLPLISLFLYRTAFQIYELVGSEVYFQDHLSRLEKIILYILHYKNPVAKY